MPLTHLDEAGAMHMVDVSQKSATVREARAEAHVVMSAAARRELKVAKKGDVLAAARLAGIMAAKRTWELIPLCHALLLSRVTVDLTPNARGVRIETYVSCIGVTGVEMEALTAASVSALTIYDMLKSVDRAMRIERVQLLEKRGGKSGTFKR